MLDRVIWIVLDGVGAGELPDAGVYGDRGSNTLGNLAQAFHQRNGRTLRLPNLQEWGIANITHMDGLTARQPGQGFGAYGRAMEQSCGKDTTSGHWEMAGLVVTKPFATFPTGFSEEIVERWVRENGLPGVLGNKAASGTDILKELGEEHVRTGKPILYTSADSVWQVAAHETAFGLERLYEICKSARKICDELQIGRVIARPFVGDSASSFKRTYHRKDYAQLPFAKTHLDLLVENRISTLGIGKISNIYAGQGIIENIDTEGNTDGIRVIMDQLDHRKKGLIYCNLIDFDMLYGHRRDIDGFGVAMEEFDRAIPQLRNKLTPRDLIVIAADHGNDPTFKGTDHTREYIPLLAFSPGQKLKGSADIGIRSTFADVGASVVHALLGREEPTLAGRSFLKEMGLTA